MTLQVAVIGITADAEGEKFLLGRSYADMVQRVGGTPVILPCSIECIDDYLRVCDGFIFSGGDDPDTRQWGIPLHPAAKPIDPQRQAFEWALLDALAERPTHPVLGVCLGMQMMALHAGGALDQHLPDALPTAADHWGRKMHTASGELGEGLVTSHHRQAITEPGTLRIVATAHDGVIEAVQADDHPFYLGVQWHPERTEDDSLGFDLIARLVLAAHDRKAH